MHLRIKMFVYVCEVVRDQLIYQLLPTSRAMQMHFGAKASAEIEMMRRVSDHPHFLTTVVWSRKERFVVYERMDDWITLQKLLQGMRRGIIPVSCVALTIHFKLVWNGIAERVVT